MYKSTSSKIIIIIKRIAFIHTKKTLQRSLVLSSFYGCDQTRCLNWRDIALNPKRLWLPSKKVFQETVQQYQNNLQAGFPLWRLEIWVACEEERRELSTEKLDCWFGIDAFNKNKRIILCQTSPANTLLKKYVKWHALLLYVSVKTAEVTSG